MDVENSMQPSPQEQGVARYVALACAIFASLMAIYFGYSYFIKGSGTPGEPPQNDSKATYDWAEAVSKKPEVSEAKSLSDAKKYDEAVAKLETLKGQTSNVGEQSVIDMDIAGILYKKNALEGARAYAAIKNNESYPEITRGTALLQVYLLFSGTGNKELMRPFFTENEFTEYDTKGTLALRSAQMTHQLYPFVIAGIVMARAEIVEKFDPYFPLKEREKPIAALNREVERVYETYVGLFDSSIAFLERNEGMRQYIPNTYLAKANFLGDLARNGYVFERVDLPNEAKAVYEEGLRRARAQSAVITEQFILARFANYLLGMKMTDEATPLITTLSEATLTPMFKGYLLTERAKTEIPFLLEYARGNTSLSAHFGI